AGGPGRRAPRRPPARAPPAPSGGRRWQRGQRRKPRRKGSRESRCSASCRVYRPSAYRSTSDSIKLATPQDQEMPEENPLPEKIGKYEITGKIGSGGFGAVYRGRDPYIKRTVAIKTCQLNDEEIK